MKLQHLTTALLFVLIAGSVSGQVNTEKYRKYLSDDVGFIFNLTTTFTVKSGNTEYTAYRGTGRLDYNGKTFDSFIIGNFEFKNTTDEKIENQGFVHWRGITHIAKRTTWEVFLQRQYDEFIDLNSRNLAGTGIKYRVIQFMSKADSAKTLDVNISTGLMYETEEYAVDNENIFTNLWRSTSFISVDWLIKEKLNLTGVFYFQPAFNNISNYRIASDVTFEVAIAKSLHFVTEISLRYNNIPITDVKKHDLSIQNGLRVEIR